MMVKPNGVQGGIKKETCLFWDVTQGQDQQDQADIFDSWRQDWQVVLKCQNVVTALHRVISQ